MSIEAMKQALEALEAEAAGWDSVSPVTRDAIIALLAAIEEAEKPWVKTYSEGQPVYTTPEEQPRRWQRLTEKEIARREIVNPIRVRIMQEAYDLADRDDSEGYNSVKVMCSEVLGMIDRLLDERQPEPKPLAWIDANHLQHAMREPSVCRLMPVPGKGYVPLYATLREWQGLTDEDLDIRALWEILADMNNADGSIVVQFARAIEAKLKERNT